MLTFSASSEIVSCAFVNENFFVFVIDLTRNVVIADFCAVCVRDFDFSCCNSQAPKQVYSKNNKQ
jgi:hypothetical protein